MTQALSETCTETLGSRLWQELTRAPHDRHHDWRTPVLATQGVDGSGPQARTVVLRHADASLWSLHVFTDARSPKCAELTAQSLAQLSFWSKRLSWQLRVAVQATVHAEGPLVDAAWERVSQSPAAADYTAVLAPGCVRPDRMSSAQGLPDHPSAHHLAVLSFQIKSMDWLALSQGGHQRARLRPGGLVEWLVP